MEILIQAFLTNTLVTDNDERHAWTDLLQEKFGGIRQT
jgi:hypothetical protein